MSWSHLRRIIERANKQYPYKLWMGYPNDSSPVYYLIESGADEQSALKNLSHELRFTFELIS